MESPVLGAKSSRQSLIGFKRSYTTILIALAAIARLATVPLTTHYLSQFPGYRPVSPLLQSIGLLIEIGLTYAVIRTGLNVARRVGLGWPPIDGWDGDVLSPTRVRRAVITALVLGAIIGVMIPLVGAILESNWQIRPIRDPSLVVAGLGAIGAGVVEEVWLRLGAMSIFAWLLAKLSAFGRRLMGAQREADPSRISLWIANALAAILFGVVHLPQAKAMAVTVVPSLIAFVIVGNAALGLVCGWLYWRRGLFSAMIAHITVGLMLKVVLPIAGIH